MRFKKPDQQRSDYLRYLLLAIHGGIYADTDTIRLKSPSEWVRDYSIWKGGEGWLGEADVARLQAVEGDDVDEREKVYSDVLGPVKAVVGLEADVGDRADWADWWPRPVSASSAGNWQGWLPYLA